MDIGVLGEALGKRVRVEFNNGESAMADDVPVTVLRIDKECWVVWDDGTCDGPLHAVAVATTTWDPDPDVEDWAIQKFLVFLGDAHTAHQYPDWFNATDVFFSQAYAWEIARVRRSHKPSSENKT